MKKIIMLLMAFVLALTSVTGVFAENDGAEPVAEEAVEQEVVLEDTPMPIQQEDTIQSKVFLKIYNDGSAVYTIKNYTDDETFEQYKAQIELVNQMYAAEGISYQLGEDGAKKYVEMTTISEKGESFSILGGTSQNGSFAVNKGLFSTEYFTTGNFDSRVSTEETPVEDSIMYAQLTVELPFPVSYSNADYKEGLGTKLIWNIYEGRINPVEIKFSAPNYLTLGILLLVILLIVVIAIVIKNKKNIPTDAELIEDAMHCLEGETDEFVEDPFENMTDEEIEADISEEETIEEKIEDFVEEITEEIEEEETTEE